MPVRRSLNNTAGIWPSKEANRINTVCLQRTYTSSDLVALAHSLNQTINCFSRPPFLPFVWGRRLKARLAADRPYWLDGFSIYFHSRLKLCLCMCASQRARRRKKCMWKRDLNQNSTRRNNGGSYNPKILWPLCGWHSSARHTHLLYSLNRINSSLSKARIGGIHCVSAFARGPPRR